MKCKNVKFKAKIKGKDKLVDIFNIDFYGKE